MKNQRKEIVSRERKSAAESKEDAAKRAGKGPFKKGKGKREKPKYRGYQDYPAQKEVVRDTNKR